MTTGHRPRGQTWAMTTSTLPPSWVGVRSGRNSALLEPDLVPIPSGQPCIRRAGLADVPAIARITGEGPAPVGIEPAVMSRATRLLLTHVALEHGALSVEQVVGG